MEYRIEPGIKPSEATQLAAGAEWSWTEAWVARFLAVASGFTARAQDGRALGIVTCVLWDDLAWLGSMAIAPDARRQGIGRALLRHAIAHAEAQGAATIGLDATPMGRDLYESEGFVADGESALWRRAGPMRAPSLPSGEYAIYPVSPAEIMELVACDTPRFGASRARWLAARIGEEPQRSFVAVHRKTGAFSGHALVVGERIGPLIADAPEAAAWLLAAIERAGGPPMAIVPDWNPDAARVFAAAGYERGRSCTRMWRGPPRRGRPETQFALGGWAIG